MLTAIDRLNKTLIDKWHDDCYSMFTDFEYCCCNLLLLDMKEETKKELQML